MASIGAVVTHWRKAWVLELSADACWVCRRSDGLTRAHVDARRNGGRGGADNLLLACKRCNDWVDFVAEHEGAAGAVEWVRQCCAATAVVVPPSVRSEFAGMECLGLSAEQREQAIVVAFQAYLSLASRWSKSTKRALAAKKARGEKTGGDVPYGYRLADDGRTLEANEGEAAVVGVVRDLRAAGLSLRKVVEQLEQRGIRSRTGKPFIVTQIVRMEAQRHSDLPTSAESARGGHTTSGGLGGGAQ